MSESITSRAKAIYQESRHMLERDHFGKFVSIEPDSGDIFLADSFDAAVAQAVERYPDRVSHTIHIGKDAVFHIDY